MYMYISTYGLSTSFQTRSAALTLTSRHHISKQSIRSYPPTTCMVRGPTCPLQYESSKQTRKTMKYPHEEKKIMQFHNTPNQIILKSDGEYVWWWLGKSICISIVLPLQHPPTLYPPSPVVICYRHPSAPTPTHKREGSDIKPQPQPHPSPRMCPFLTPIPSIHSCGQFEFLAL